MLLCDQQHETALEGLNASPTTPPSLSDKPISSILFQALVSKNKERHYTITIGDNNSNGNAYSHWIKLRQHACNPFRSKFRANPQTWHVNSLSVVTSRCKLFEMRAESNPVLIHVIGMARSVALKTS
jgi:hypothetical protein